jgi:hypothetical protein
MKKFRNLAFVGLGVLIGIAVFAAASLAVGSFGWRFAAGSSGASAKYAAGNGLASAEAAPAAAAKYALDGAADIAQNDIAEAAPAAASENQPEAAAGNAMSGTAVPDTRNVDQVAPDRKLIRNISLSFETVKFNDFTSALEKTAQALGGYAESSYVYRNSDDGLRSANYTYRIPRDRADQFVDSTEGAATMTSRSENVQDITLDYHDVEARKQALQTEYDSLTRLLEQAGDADTVISLSQRLSELRYQLDSYESDIRRYDNQVDYATVSVDVTETRVESATGESSAWEKIRIGFLRNLRAVGGFLAAFLIGVLTSLPSIALAGAVIVFIALIVRKVRKSRKKDANLEDKRQKDAPEAREVPEEGPDGSTEEQSDTAKK